MHYSYNWFKTTISKVIRTDALVCAHWVHFWVALNALSVPASPVVQFRGGSRVSGKGIQIYKGVGVRFAYYISFFLNFPWKWNNLVSLSIFIGYLKMEGGGGGGGFEWTPWTPSGSATAISLSVWIQHMWVKNSVEPYQLASSVQTPKTSCMILN